MKNLFLLSALLIFSFGFAQNYSESFTAAQASDFEDFDTYVENTGAINEFAISANMAAGEVTFNAPDKIEYINIYNSDNQEIFSAMGSIIKDSKINVSFLSEGTYYLEIVIGKNMGSHKLMVQ